MRGLPPIPDDVLRVRLGFDIDHTWASIGWWVFSPGAGSATAAYLDGIASAVILGPLSHVLELMHAGATCTTCRVESFGAVPLTVVRSPGPNAGRWVGGTTAQAALGLHWLTGERGRRGGAITHVPAFPDAFTDNHAAINQLAFGNALGRGTDTLNDFAAMPGFAGGFAVMGTVERSAAGVPLGASTFVPFQGVNPTPRIATIRRRISANGAVTPV